jgi:hypothetical protein
MNPMELATEFSLTRIKNEPCCGFDLVAKTNSQQIFAIVFFV